MVCALPAPIWTTSAVGLVSATENVADGYINLVIAPAAPVNNAPFVYYLIYYSLTEVDLFAQPKLVATATNVSVPNTLITTSHLIAATVAEFGIERDFSVAGLTPVNTNLYLYPAQTALALPLSPVDGYIVTNDVTAYPAADGYLKIGSEAILYSAVVDGYGFAIGSRDPFKCQGIVGHSIDTPVYLFRGFGDGYTAPFRPLPSNGLPKPTWADVANPGIQHVEDSGLGTSVTVDWLDATIPKGFSQIYYNVYQSQSLVAILNGLPLGFTTATSVLVPNLSPGRGYYYLVRAAFQLDNLPLTTFNLLSPNFYAYPAGTTLTSAYGENQLGNLFVASTQGYPAAGFLNLGSEVLQYSSLTSNSFNVVQRDVFGVGLQQGYPVDNSVVFFKGIEDSNRFYFRTDPSWDNDSNVPRLPGGPDYYQDADGYRDIPADIVTEDHSADEIQDEQAPSFNYCGYRFQDFTRLYSRQICGTYSGGRQDGFSGGIDVNTANIQRAEILLQLDSVPWVLLRRKHTGKPCPMLSMRTEHPKARCGICFGTEFLGGYDRIFNPRMLTPSQPNPNGFILGRISPYVNDLDLSPERGLAQVDQLDIWTLPAPTIKDRDVLVRYNLDPVTGVYSEEFRYEVLNVTRNKLLFNQDGIQKCSIKKLDKTREIMKFVVALV